MQMQLIRFRNYIHTYTCGDNVDEVIGKTVYEEEDRAFASRWVLKQQTRKHLHLTLMGSCNGGDPITFPWHDISSWGNST